MFTKIRFSPPYLTGNWNTDGPNVIAAISNYLLVLNQKSALEIDEARIRAAQGVVFPATQIPSTDPNTQDDYQEKDFSASVTDGSGAGLVLTVTKATATKVGRDVSFRIHVVYPVTASGAAAQINGLPYVTDGIHSAVVYTSGAGGAIVAQVAGTAVNIFALGAVAITNANLSAAFVVISGSYSV